MLWFLLVLLFILCFFERLLSSKTFESIPGPKGLYLLHNALDFTMAPAKLFYHFRGLSNTYKRLYKLRLGPVKVIIVHHPEDVEAVIQGTKYNSKGYLYSFIEPWLKDGLLLSKGKKWHIRRKMMTPAFHFNILNNFKPVIERNAESLLKDIQNEISKPETDISPLINNFALNSICETAMGTALDKESNSFSKKYKESIYKLGQYAVYRAQRIWMYPDFIFNLTRIGRKQKEILKILTSFRRKVVEKRREYGIKLQIEQDQILDDDSYNVEGGKRRMVLLDILLQAEKDGFIDDKGVGEEVDTFMFGGHDTTSIALKFTLMLLANHQEAQDKIIEEYKSILNSMSCPVTIGDLSQMKYLECCIKESLRLYPPLPTITRNIDQTLKLGNYEVPSGTECVILIYDLHRRTDQFDEPLEFRPERFQKEPTWHPYAYIPFSAGPRNCIGQKFAMMELKLALLSILRRFRILPVTTPRDIILITDYVLRVKQPIYVKFEERFPENVQ
ncbi:cytochrome P450 4C1-like isoform X1 [Colias croceus]|uniref:cytochrome P450 4C1-like isoform X1 n=1 Tax=Colias crocea TaxID=72248 RepID=UPI001E27D8A8|nr:cytochrome P450 4C1-like isoform X1 [Colias croceus]